MSTSTKRTVGARARLFDRLGRYFIALGGLGVIAAVLGIFLFIAREALPLAQGATLTAGSHLGLPSGALATAMDPYGEVVLVADAGGVEFRRLGDGQSLGRTRPAALDSVSVAAAVLAPEDGVLGLVLADGRIVPGKFAFDVRFDGTQRQIAPRLSFEDPLWVGEGPLHAALVRHDGEARLSAAALGAAGQILVVRREQREGLLGPGPVAEDHWTLTLPALEGQPSAVLLDRVGRQLLVGTDRGEIGEWALGDVGDEPVWKSSFRATDQAVTALGYVLGENSVAIGDAAGQVLVCFKAGQGAQRGFKIAHHLEAHAHAVRAFVHSARDRQLLSVDAGGEVALHHVTTGKTYLRRQLDPAGVAALYFAPKADGFLVLGQSQGLQHFALDNPHPDVTWQTLFGKVWYEGYDAPAYVWQSTGGSDDFEPKFSLVPLIFGTVKGTFYALLFALPLAVLAALYTAEFASPGLRKVVKPAVEMMASLPSVILGFLAGLWLAPLLEKGLDGVFFFLLLLPLVVLAAAWVKGRLPAARLRWLGPRAELALLTGLVVAAGFLAFGLVGPWVERLLFGGDLRQWLGTVTRYEQRNSLVVGFAMGFAIVPLIFTICEDALSAVPAHLRAGSLALGATPWQTAVKVILPMALPGIFSATMIGFGRAVGETMVVLMATGNTPITDWSLFNGLRAISANIAVELPEAPHASSLYRVLFLSGLLLFGLTFLINTVAELVRQRLRDKDSRL
ncbi:MAG: ABC transporter permease subunit [Candidatus Latescibacteria bacterium]|nr:ABC transporter permease subunit [Candidatus Latescibacterota bacterium]